MHNLWRTQVFHDNFFSRPIEQTATLCKCKQVLISWNHKQNTFGEKCKNSIQKRWLLRLLHFGVRWGISQGRTTSSTSSSASPSSCLRSVSGFEIHCNHIIDANNSCVSYHMYCGILWWKTILHFQTVRPLCDTLFPVKEVRFSQLTILYTVVLESLRTSRTLAS